MKFKGIKVVIGILLIIVFTGCTDKPEAKRVLEFDGYENITIGGYSFFGCSRDDVFRTEFTATKNGKTVDGTVCGGWISGSVIRIK